MRAVWIFAWVDLGRGVYSSGPRSALLQPSMRDIRSRSSSGNGLSPLRLVLAVEQPVAEADDRICTARRVYERRWRDVELAVRSARAERDAVAPSPNSILLPVAVLSASATALIGWAHELLSVQQGRLRDGRASRRRRPRAFGIPGAVRESGGAAAAALDALQDARVAAGAGEDRAGGLSAGPGPASGHTNRRRSRPRCDWGWRTEPWHNVPLKVSLQPSSCWRVCWRTDRSCRCCRSGSRSRSSGGRRRTCRRCLP